VRMIDREGNEVEVPEAEVPAAFRSGQVGFAPGTTVPTYDMLGGVRNVSPAEFDPTKHLVASPEDAAKAAMEEQYGGLGGGLIAGGIGAGNALALGYGKGLAVQAAGAFGGEEAAERTRQAIRGYTETNPTANIAGEVVGTVAPLALGGIEGVVGQGARGLGSGIRATEALGTLAETGVRGLVGEGAGNLLARTGQKALSYGARGALEGGLFGTGGAYSEAVLQNEDLTAERLMSGAVHGALMGGAIGGGLGAGSQLIEDAAKTVMPHIRNAVEEFAQERAFKAAGGLKSWAKKAEARAGGAEEIGKDLLARGHIQPGWNVEQVAQSVDRDVAKTGAKIGDMMKDLDAAAVTAGEGNLVNGSNLIERAWNEVVQPRLNSPESRDIGEAMAKRLEPFFDDFAGKEIGHAKLWEIRKGLDQRIKWESQARSPMADAMKELRNVFEDELTTSADRAAKNLGISDTFAKDWKETKRLYSSLRFASDMANDGLAGKLGNNWASLTDQIAGGFGSVAGFAKEAAAEHLSPLSLLHPQAALAGMLTTVGHKILRERGSSVLAAAANRVAKIGAVAEEAQAVNQQVSRAVEQFLSKGTTVAAAAAGANADRIGAQDAGVPSAAAKIFGARAGDEGKPKTPKSLDGQYHEGARAVATLASQPAAVSAHMQKTLAPLIENAPQMALKVSQKQSQALSFLQSKLPTQAVSAPLSTTPQKGVPDTDKASFLRTLEAVQRPMSVVEDLEKGRLSKEGVEALKTVYPETYQDLRHKVLAKVIELSGEGQDVPYEKKLQIGRLFDAPVDPTQTPEFTKAIGAIFGEMNQGMGQPPEEVAAGPAGPGPAGPGGGGGRGGAPARKVDTAGALETRTTELEKGLG